MRYWWVNQNQTYEHEVSGGFLWSPKTNKNGARNQFYDNMTEVAADDLVFSFCDTFIKAVGTAQGRAESAIKPDFGSVGDQWDDEGWLVPVEFEAAKRQIKPKDIIDDLRPHMAPKYAPLQANGSGNQGVYLAEVSEAFAKVLLNEFGPQFRSLGEATAEPEDDLADEKAETALQGRTDIAATQKSQLVSSRRGQGIFRANVRLNEKGCRLTGVTDPRFLIASHIKPWRVCTDQEKLDGCNGLLLSPHVDKLFDSGFIGFADDGSVIRSDELPAAVWESWRLAMTAVKPFNEKQREFLAYHRVEILK
ncbi:MAG: HNH endonuclease [Erythrobacter sp.]|uniref:HNH endonuclease n=1 Tax=Erythrobacter sp. TaxID=1042 RepID=UPI0032632C36